MSATVYVPTPQTRELVRTLHARGALVRVRRGQYARPNVDAAVLAAAARLDAVASHGTAAALWGLPTLGRPESQLHLTRPRRKQGTLRPIRRRCSTTPPCRPITRPSIMVYQ